MNKIFLVLILLSGISIDSFGQLNGMQVDSTSFLFDSNNQKIKLSSLKTSGFFILSFTKTVEKGNFDSLSVFCELGKNVNVVSIMIVEEKHEIKFKAKSSNCNTTINSLFDIDGIFFTKLHISKLPIYIILNSKYQILSSCYSTIEVIAKFKEYYLQNDNIAPRPPFNN